MPLPEALDELLEVSHLAETSVDFPLISGTDMSQCHLEQGSRINISALLAFKLSSLTIQLIQSHEDAQLELVNLVMIQTNFQSLAMPSWVDWGHPSSSAPSNPGFHPGSVGVPTHLEALSTPFPERIGGCQVGTTRARVTPGLSLLLLRYCLRWKSFTCAGTALGETGSDSVQDIHVVITILSTSPSTPPHIPWSNFNTTPPEIGFKRK